MVVLSLFDGMSCGQIAINELGYKDYTYYASEIEKYPIQCTQHNFPNTIQLGDVRNVDVSKLKPINILLGGSPCQSFSFAGKRKGMSTKDSVEIYTLDKYLELKSEDFELEGQSYLFWEYMRILTDIRKYNPDVIFLLENVEMGKKWERVLSEAIGVFGVHINSALVSAQNRKRIYWTNIRTRKEGMFGDIYSDIPQPKDECILLKDILESDVDEKYYLSEKSISRIINSDFGNEFRNDSEKSDTVTTRFGRMCNSETYLKIDIKGGIKLDQNKASCFTAGANSGGNHSDMDLIVHNTLPRSSKRGKGGTGPLSKSDGKSYCLDTGQTNAIEIVAQRGRYLENGEIQQELEPRNDGKTNCLTSVQKDNLVIQLNPSKESGGQQPYQQNRLYDIEGISPALQAQLSTGSNLINTSRIRRLTPTEVQRLQTIPEWYDMSILSDTQIYKACGNGWTIKVIMHILSFLPNSNK